MEQDSLFTTFKNSHKNIKISAFIGFLSSISTTLFFDTIMTIFIFNNIANIEGPTHKNEMLGTIETTYGLSELIFAIPVGYLADRYGRSQALKCGAIMEYITLLFTLFTVYSIANQQFNETVSYTSIIIIHILLGISWGLSSGPIGALVADSTPDGQRSKIYMITNTFSLLGSLIGPILIIILSEFSSNTDDWDSKKLATIIYIGIFLHLIPVTGMFLYKDIIKIESELVSEQNYNELLDIVDVPIDIPKTDKFFTPIPCILFFAEFVILVGSGLSVKFFPLFLKNDCHMSMKTIQILAIIIIFEIIVFQYLAQRISKYLGRIYTTFILNMIGIITQTMLGLANHDNTLLIGFLYTFRVSIMNSSSPLMSSALMDIVPKNHRARWESLYSIMTLGWCGSAFLGGLINDKIDYGNTFLITSGFHFVGNCIYLLIRNSIPDEN